MPTTVQSLEALAPLRYLAVAGLSVLVWDTILTFPREWKYIWRKSPILLRASYAFNRYALILLMGAFFTTTFRPSNVNLSSVYCQNIMDLVAIMACLADFVGNTLTIFRVFIIWDRDKRVLITLVAGGLVAFTSSTVFASVIAHTIRNANILHWAPSPVSSCVVKAGSVVRYFYLSVWSTQILFDFFAAWLVFFNALSIPRKPGMTVWTTLYRDGMPIILAAFFTRMISIILCVQHNSLDFRYGFTFNASMISVFNSRLVLRLLDTHSIKPESNDLIEQRTEAGQSYFTFRTLPNDKSASSDTFSMSSDNDRPRSVRRITLHLLHKVGSWGT